MKNQVIKNLTPEMGKEIIKYWDSSGVDTRRYNGSNCESDGDVDIYYGVIDGKFSFYTLNEVQKANAEIIEFPTVQKEPQRGDLIMVWDFEGDRKREKVFLAEIEGANYPVICVDESDDINKPPFGKTNWRNYELIPKPTELEKQIAYHEEQLLILKNK